MPYSVKTISLDENTANLLKQIAELESESEPPNESRAIRRLIRQRALELGLSVDEPSSESEKPKPSKR